MKKLLTLLFLPIFAHGVELNAELCSANTTFYVEGGCPADLTTPLAGGNVTENSAEGSVSCVGANCVGNVHAYADAAADGTPEYASCLSGAGALNKQVDAITGEGTSNFSFTNLTSDTSIRITYCFEPVGSGYDNRSYNDLVAAADFPTLPGAPGGGEVAGRFVGAGGSDSNNGTSHAQRWATLAKVQQELLPVGTDIWLLTGTVFENQTYSVGHNGQVDDRAVIGTYCMDGGTTPIAYNSADSDCSAGKAEINGTYEDSCGAGNADGSTTCAVDGGGAIPSSSFNGLVSIVSPRQYVTIQDIKVYDSAGVGVFLDNANGTPSKSIIQRVDVRNSVRSGMRVNRAVANDNTIFRDNTLDYVSIGFCDGTVTKWPHCFNVANAQSFPNANTGNLAENNLVTNCGGEGIGVVRASGNIIRGNTILRHRRPGLYVDAGSNNIIENNIVAGGGGFPACGGSSSSHGIAIGSEFYSGYSAADLASTGNVVRNNIAVNGEDGFRLYMQGDSRTLGVQTGAFVYGNTFVSSGGATSESLWIAPTAGNVEFFEFTNNLLLNEATSTCPGLGGSANIDYNTYDLQLSDADCRGPNDTIATNTGITLDPTWGNNGTNAPTVAEVTPAGDALNAGIAEVAPVVDASDYPLFNELNGGAYNCTVTELDWEKEMFYDYECTTRGATPDAGAIEVP